MKKLVMSIGACLLLASGLAMAKDTTFSGEIMDRRVPREGGTSRCSRRWAPTTLRRVRRPA